MTVKGNEAALAASYSQAAMAIVRHISLNMLNQAKKDHKNASIKGLRKKAGWGESTLHSSG